MYATLGFNVHVHCNYYYVLLQANEILMAGVKLTATEAYERGLVTRVFPRAEFQQRLAETAQHIASLPPKVYTYHMYMPW